MKNGLKIETQQRGYNGQAFLDIVTKIDIALMKKTKMIGSDKKRRSIMDVSLLISNDACKKMRRELSPQYRKTENNPLERDLRIRPPEIIRYSSLSTRKTKEEIKKQTVK